MKIDASQKAALIDKIRYLEAIVSRTGDRKSTRVLLNLLATYSEVIEPVGPFGACQKQLESYQAKVASSRILFEPSEYALAIDRYLQIVERHGIKVGIAIAQLFAAGPLTIGGALTHCDRMLQFFDADGVIPRICFDCYKVQILPASLAAMFGSCAVLLNLDLPNRNTRKSMVELRKAVKYPYKSYIYCESEEDAHLCARLLRKDLAAAGVSDVKIGISHGCSEYGNRYAGFKYAPDGSHRAFERPDDWDRKEQAHFERAPLGGAVAPPAPREIPRITLRDVVAFQTWIDYASLMREPVDAALAGRIRSAVPPGLAATMKEQGDRRREELAELRGLVSPERPGNGTA